MFCSKCGASNPNGAIFCSRCGERLAIAQSPVAPKEPAAPEAPVDPQFMPIMGQIMPPEAGSMTEYFVPQPKKKNKALPFIIAGVAMAVIAVVLILILGGSGYSDPEELALDFADAITEFDVSDLEDTMHPDILDTEEWYDIRQMIDSERKRSIYDDYETENFRIVDVYDEYDRYDLREMEDVFESDYDMVVHIEEAIRYQIHYERHLNGRISDESGRVTVVKIDGRWYAHPESVR